MGPWCGVSQLQRSATGVWHAISDATRKSSTYIIEEVPKHCGSLRVFHCESSFPSALRSKVQLLTVHGSYLQSAETVTRQLTRSHVPVSDQAQRFLSSPSSVRSDALFRTCESWNDTLALLADATCCACGLTKVRYQHTMSYPSRSVGWPT
jgi:hypothetical protein